MANFKEGRRVGSLQLRSFGGAAQWPMGLNKTRGYFCPPAPRSGWSSGSYLTASSIWGWQSSGCPSKLTSSDLPLSTDPEKSVLRAGRGGFLCPPALLDLVSTAKPQLAEPKSRIHFFAFCAFWSHLFFSEALKIECLNTLGMETTWATMSRKLLSSQGSSPSEKGGGTSTEQAN